MKTTDLSVHIAKTYATLRIALVFVGFALPLVLSAGGIWLANEPLAGSMSAYYYVGDGKLRDWFVGSLYAVGALLIIYRGYTQFENYALNLGGVFAVLVALYPMAPPVKAGAVQPGENPFSMHGLFAGAFFFCIAYVCIFQASATLSLVADRARRNRYRRIYRILGVAMVVSPAIAFVLTMLRPFQHSLVFFVEAAGVYMFSVYWSVKSFEIHRTQADRRAAAGMLEIREHSQVEERLKGSGELAARNAMRDLRETLQDWTK
jgi:hypothetical protein